MNYECFTDPETGEPHFARHGVSDDDVLDVLEEPLLLLKGRDETLIAYGQTRNGRWLEVVYSHPDPQTLRLITAYTPGVRELRAARRRIEKKR